MKNLVQLHNAIAQVAPIDGVGVDKDNNYRIDFDESASSEQRIAAEEMLSNFVLTPEPEWDGFRAAIALNETWERVLNQSPAIAATIVSLWSRMDGESITQVLPLWNRLAERYQSSSSFTVEEIEGLNAIASDNHIPVMLGEDGQMSIVL